uniref:sensor histidine kinase n=1 Tax=Ndongobacter massiliensis TaxID=1871025 RepID=UPI000930E6D2|nr:HAMP domain-containing sensor histidine kinase [Ndongobacter massiliensis]
MKQSLRKRLFFPILFVLLLSFPLYLITHYGMTMYDRMQRAEDLASIFEGKTDAAIAERERMLAAEEERRPLLQIRPLAAKPAESLKDAFVFQSAEGQYYEVRAVAPSLFAGASFLFIPLGILVLAAFVVSEFVARRVKKKNLEPLQEVAAYLNRMITGDFDPETDPPLSEDLELSEVLGDSEQRAAFKKMISQLRENEILRRQFSANVTHELKSPLTSINGYAEMIESGMTDGEDAQRFAGIIRREGMRLLGMINEIIQLSEFDTGHVRNEEQEKLDLTMIVQEECRSLSRMARERNVEVRVTAPSPMWIQGSRRLIADVVRNLLSNAIKYSKEAGGRVEVVLQETEEWVTLTVHDNGIGIDPAEQKRIFERFYVVDKARTRQSGAGTGLGLSLVKHTMQLHGGDVRVHSKLGIGSSFIVRFPNSVETADSMERKESENQPVTPVVTK